MTIIEQLEDKYKKKYGGLLFNPTKIQSYNMESYYSGHIVKNFLDRFEDDKIISTSKVVKELFLDEGFFIITKNSIYQIIGGNNE